MNEGFEDRLTQALLKVCTAHEALEGELLGSPDIDFRWDAFEREYIGYGVKDFNDYPEVAIAWAGYAGMGVAARWDQDWNRYKTVTLKDFLGPRGWDDMDEKVTRDILKMPLNSKAAEKTAAVLSSCSEEVLDFIRHEGVEPGTADAFQCYVLVCRVMYKIGAAIELHRLGYKFVAQGV